MIVRDEQLKLIWRHTHRDYRGKLDDQRSILVLRGGTCLVPLDELTEAEIEDRLPGVFRAEARRRHIGIGARCVCERCGQDLEWNGQNWWDRGSDTKCGPYKEKGEIVQEDYTKGHFPNY